MRTDLLIMACAFVGATLVALALGAVNTGTALTFGQLAFTVSALYVMLER